MVQEEAGDGIKGVWVGLSVKVICLNNSSEKRYSGGSQQKWLARRQEG